MLKELYHKFALTSILIKIHSENNVLLERKKYKYFIVCRKIARLLKLLWPLNTPFKVLQQLQSFPKIKV